MLHRKSNFKDCFGYIFYDHKDLGPGLLESVYEEILFYDLRNRNLFVERQKAIPTIWKNEKLNLGFRADLIVSKKVLIEIKSIEGLAPVQFKQVLTYLKLSEIKLGLLINFNEALLKNGIRRIVNGL
jgi:GxxExxY protein